MSESYSNQFEFSDRNNSEEEFEIEKIKPVEVFLDVLDRVGRGEILSKEDILVFYGFRFDLNLVWQECDETVSDDYYSLREQRNQDEDIRIIYDCLLEEIAHTPEQIHQNTKVYVGPLSPMVFVHNNELVADYHIYTRFPRNRIEYAGIKVASSDKNLLIEKTKKDFFLSERAERLLRLAATKEFGTKENLVFFVFTVEDLGLNDEASIAGIYEAASNLGFKLCEHTDAASLRHAYNLDCIAATEPITDPVDRKEVLFQIFNGNGERELRTDNARPERGWGLDTRFAFKAIR